MTAKEFLKILPKDSNWELSSIVENAMIEFAKYHVEQTLKEVSEKARADQEFIDMGGEFEDIPIYEAYVIKDSILDAYPLENIK